MIEVVQHFKPYYDEVIEFAKKIGKWDMEGDLHSLKRNLDYLDNYFDKNLTRCDLNPDRPYGFGFSMFKKVDGDWKYWFNGGLLYHGPIDGFGSGAGPVFAVTLNPTNGWSIHT